MIDYDLATLYGNDDQYGRPSRPYLAEKILLEQGWEWDGVAGKWYPPKDGGRSLAGEE